MASTLAPCTLSSGHYHFGVGALANSLYRSGFRGTLHVGYEPPLPPWARTVRQDGERARLEVEPDFFIDFTPWPSRHVLSVEKANFLLHVLDEAAPEATAGLFFDADVVVTAGWRFFEGWLEEGVALCLDNCYPLVPSGHPWRRGWRDLATAAGHGATRALDHYVNSSFVGVPRAHREVAACWAALIAQYLRQQPGTIDKVTFGPRETAFTGDQDMLNAALMATAAPLSIVGPEGLGFNGSGFMVMSAMVDPVKPWQKNFLASALRGSPPGMPDKLYWRYADGPIPLFGRGRLAAARAALRAASAIGRFYSRN